MTSHVIPPRTWVATAIAVAAWGFAALATVLLLLARPPLNESLWFFLVDVTVACVYGTVAAVILRRRMHVVPFLLAVAAVGGGLAAFGFAYDVWSVIPGGLPPVSAIAALQGTAWVPGTLALFLVVPWLVRDHPLGNARWGLLIGISVTAALTVANVFFYDWPATELFALAVVVGLVTAAETEWRHRRGPETERNGLGWLALGTTILAVSFAPLAVPYGTLGLPIWTTPALHLVSQAVFPAAVLVVVLRSRMWGLAMNVSRAVLAGLLTTGLLGVYLLVTVLMTRLLPGDAIAQLVGAGAVAVAVQPLRLRLAARVQKLVYGAAADPSQVVRSMGQQLGLAGSVDELLAGLAEDVGRSMRLESVAVVLDGRPSTTWGRPSSAPDSLPLVHRGELVGRLEVTSPPGELLGSRAEETLRDLSGVVATAVAVARAAEAVEDMRNRLSRARLEERRVIRREIHDGLGPSLAGLRLGLQGARNLIDLDPAAGRELLGELQTELDDRVAAVRTLSHHLLPPVLDELGLGAGLEELSGRHADEGLEVVVRGEGLDGLDTPLAVAVYGIVSEALANVSRHAGARHCWIDARRTDDGLTVTVADDGVGVAPDARSGVGSQSMRERASELGGRLDVEPRPAGGTVVTASFPAAVVARG